MVSAIAQNAAESEGSNWDPARLWARSTAAPTPPIRWATSTNSPILAQSRRDPGRHRLEGFRANPCRPIGSPRSLSRWGTRVAFVAQFLGRQLAYTYEVKEMVPNERFRAEHIRRSVPNGDDLHLGGYTVGRNTDDSSQPGGTVRLLESSRPDDGGLEAPCQSQGSRPAEGNPRGNAGH